MKTPLTLQRLFLGLNGMAIEGKQLNIQVIPEYDELGKVIGTKWNLKIDNTVDSENEDIIIKDFLAGYRIDNEDYNVIMKFYDAMGRFPRQIADRISSIQGSRKKKIRKTNESAFFQLLTIIRDYYDYLDDEVISILQSVKILKTKCNIAYPLLIKIPDNIQTNEDLLKHFYLLTLFNPKTLKMYKNKLPLINENIDNDSKSIERNKEFNKIDIMEDLLNIFQSEEVFNKLKDYIDDGFIEEVKNDIALRNKIRYWKKVLTLKNGKRYWISNHIFSNSIIPFKELMSDLTGINILVKNNTIKNNTINNSLNNQSSIKEDSSIKNDSSNKDGSSIKDGSSDSSFNNSNNMLLDNLVSSAFGFNF